MVQKIGDDFETDREQSIKLNDLTASLTNNTKLYGSLSLFIFDKMAEQVVETDSGFTLLNWHSLLTVTSTALATAALVYCIFITLKMRGIAMLLVAGTQHGVRAQKAGDERTDMWKLLRITPRMSTTTAATSESIKSEYPQSQSVND